tara:strand:- start:805 stop:1143 length:339 start_codon:yes stop_codon:yes gene_type:complete
MNFRYSQSDFGLGLRPRQEKERAPHLNATISGVSHRPQVSDLDKPDEKRGGNFAGERLSAFLHQPGEMDRTLGWMEAFERGNLDENMRAKRNRMETQQIMNPMPPQGGEEMA